MDDDANTERTLNGRDPKSGQFVLGHSGLGGRPKGSRNKLGEQFIADLYAKWRKHGKDVLDCVIKDDPAAFLRTVAQILPTPSSLLGLHQMQVGGNPAKKVNLKPSRSSLM